MDLLCTFRRSSLYIRTAQSELKYSDPNTYIRIGTKSEYINSDLAVRVDIFGSDLIESDDWYIRTDIDGERRSSGFQFLAYLVSIHLPSCFCNNANV
jgi:hypothetical protein